MDPKKLIRNAGKVHDYLHEIKDGRLVTTGKLKIYIPTRFAERDLAFIGTETNIVGIYAIVADDKYYGVSLINAMQRIEPTSMIKVIVDDDEYYEFYFEPGSTVLSSTNLVKRDVLVYRIYDEILAKGRIPWYLGYLELAKIFDTAKYHAGANIGANHEVTELLISLIARNPDDRTEYYRTMIKNMVEIKEKPPAFIGLKDVIYGATNTTNKLAGSYFNQGLVSALVNPTERTERIEETLRR